MNYFKSSLIILAIIFSACGGNSSGGSSASSNTNEAQTVADAEKNLNALSAFKAVDISVKGVTKASTKMLRKTLNNKFDIQKVTTNTCKDGGTITEDNPDDDKTLSYTFNNCQDGTYSINGKLIFIVTDANHISLTYKNLTVKDVGGTQYMNLTYKISKDDNDVTTLLIDGEVKQTLKSGEVNNISYSNFTVAEKKTYSESWATIDGTISLETKCTTGTYVFETVEKLVAAKDRSNNTESGILKLNGATYTYENPYVTIEVKGKSETILQSELKKRMEQHNNCEF